MKILGVHLGHDSGAALVVDGRVVADVAEERLTRIKHDEGAPIQSIEQCLRIGHLGMQDIDVIALTSLGYSALINPLFDLHHDQKELPDLKRRTMDLLRRRKSYWKLPTYMNPFVAGPKTRIVRIEHHLAHAASAYYTSGSREKQLVVTLDGAGDGVSGVVWRGEGGRITPLKRFSPEGSLGWFYGNVTEALGWWHGDAEGKTMGLAAYGDPDKARGVLDPFHPKYSAGELIEQHHFDDYSFWTHAGEVHYHLDEANAIAKLIAKHGRENIAAEAQRVLEEQVGQIVFPWLEKEGTRRLACAGGTFLNVKLNQRIWESGTLDVQHIFPNAGDAGLAVGAALHCYYQENPDAPIYPLETVQWGPEFSNEEIRDIMHRRGLAPRFEEDIAGATARLLANNKAVGWFQGRMESGPRALGGRSILISPLRVENRDHINHDVKFRESFRPLCPSMLAGDESRYFEQSRTEKFMITSFKAAPQKKDSIPAVVHVDGTVRPQSVDRSSQPLFHNLIREFGAITGEPIVLNTSFNIRGEPIVCDPRDAIRTFADTGLDYLVIGNYVVSKPGQN